VGLGDEGCGCKSYFYAFGVQKKPWEHVDRRASMLRVSSQNPGSSGLLVGRCARWRSRRLDHGQEDGKRTKSPCGGRSQAHPRRGVLCGPIRSTCSWVFMLGVENTLKSGCVGAGARPPGQALAIPRWLARRALPRIQTGGGRAQSARRRFSSPHISSCLCFVYCYTFCLLGE